MVTMDLDTEVIFFCREEVFVSTLGNMERKEFRLCSGCSKPLYVGYSEFRIADAWISTLVGYSFTIPPNNSGIPPNNSGMSYKRWNKNDFQITLHRSSSGSLHKVSPGFFTEHIIALHSIRSDKYGESPISEIEL